MHYTDEEQIEKNTLEIVLYPHITGRGGKKTYFEITSIQKCKYFSPRLLSNMIRNPKKFFKKLETIKSLEREKWYLCKIRQIDWDGVEIVSAIDVSENKNDFLRLH